MESSYYTVLDVRPEDATVAAVRSAYRRRALECHPDKVAAGASAEERAAATARFLAVQHAARILGDPVARMHYDAARLGKLVDVVGRVSDTVSWDEFDVRPEASCLECRCGGEYVVFGSGPTQDKPLHAECDSCSLLIKITR